MRYGLREDVIAAIAETAGACGIERVTLFGSRARGTYRTRSDIDLAAKGGDVVRFALELEEQVPTLLMFDVTDLNGTVSGELLREIARDGVVLYEKD